MEWGFEEMWRQPKVTGAVIGCVVFLGVEK